MSEALTTREAAIVDKCERIALAIIDTAHKITRAISGAADLEGALAEALAGKARVDAIREELIIVCGSPDSDPYSLGSRGGIHSPPRAGEALGAIDHCERLAGHEGPHWSSDPCGSWPNE